MKQKEKQKKIHDLWNNYDLLLNADCPFCKEGEASSRREVIRALGVLKKRLLVCFHAQQNKMEVSTTCIYPLMHRIAMEQNPFLIIIDKQGAFHMAIFGENDDEVQTNTYFAINLDLEKAMGEDTYFDFEEGIESMEDMLEPIGELVRNEIRMNRLLDQYKG